MTHIFTCERCSADHDRFDVPATHKRPCTDDLSDSGDHEYTCTACAAEAGGMHAGWIPMSAEPKFVCEFEHAPDAMVPAVFVRPAGGDSGDQADDNEHTYACAECAMRMGWVLITLNRSEGIQFIR